MQELIKITTDAQGASVVSGRELHGFLEVKSRFNDWIRNRIKKYDLRQNIDFVEIESESGFTENLVKPSQNETFSPSNEKGGRPEIDYALMLDTAKELAMVEGNAKGKQARRYFIDCEKRLQQTLSIPSTEQVLIQLVQQSNQLLATQQQMLSQLRSDVDSIMQGKGKKRTHAPAFHNVPPKGQLSAFIPGSTLRQQVTQRVNDYCAFHEVSHHEAYNYLYKRMYELHQINVHRLIRKPGEYIIDAIERYGFLEKVLGLVTSELVITDEY